jgi:beta-lactamase class A
MKRLLVGVSLLATVCAQGQSPVQDSIRTIARRARGTVGVAYKLAGAASYEGINTSAHLPMQSVYKFPLALFFLHLVDQKISKLETSVVVDARDWVPKEWSPLRDQHTTMPASLPLKELLEAIIVNSDNVACDILFRAAGGAPIVQDYIHSLGISDMAIVATEKEMHESWPVQYSNWTTPAAMLGLLEKFDAGEVLSVANTQLLVKWMEESPRVSGRLKGLLPTGTVVAHKPGTSDVSPEGVAAATNDVGIITLPNKKHLLITVFVTDAKATEATREWVIARITQLVYQANL